MPALFVAVEPQALGQLRVPLRDFAGQLVRLTQARFFGTEGCVEERDRRGPLGGRCEYDGPREVELLSIHARPPLAERLEPPRGRSCSHWLLSLSSVAERRRRQFLQIRPEGMHLDVVAVAPRFDGHEWIERLAVLADS